MIKSDDFIVFLCKSPVKNWITLSGNTMRILHLVKLDKLIHISS